MSVNNHKLTCQENSESKNMGLMIKHSPAKLNSFCKTKATTSFSYLGYVVTELSKEPKSFSNLQSQTRTQALYFARDTDAQFLPNFCRILKKEFKFWFSVPGGNTPQSTNYTATRLSSRKLSKLDETDTQDTAGEAVTSS